jgi:hypothetical protein
MSSPPVVVIHSNTPNLVQVLRDALAGGDTHQIVEIAGDLDLTSTGEEAIVIGDNRSLIASPASRRSARRRGPRVYVRPEVERGRAALFVIRGDNVLVSGFRLEGPTPGIDLRNRHEQGIRISPPATDGEGNRLPPINSIEFCNMEIFHWSGVGVQVVDNALARDHRELKGRLFKTNPAAVRIKGCYFHHNRHGPGEGYGVASAAGAYVMIEQNVFDENRHAIAGGSRPRNAPGRPPKNEEDFSGYTARDNLILPGGGVHLINNGALNSGWGGLIGGVIGGVIGGLIGGVPGAAIGAAIGIAIGAGVVAAGLVGWQTHQIDMHGDENSWYSSHNWQTGTAGETIMIERNTILYDGHPTHWYWWLNPLKRIGKAINIRGKPLDKAVVDGNFFRHKTRKSAIAQDQVIVLDTNVFKCGDLTANVAEGDFGQHTCGTIDLGHGRFDEEAHADITSEFSDGFDDGHQDDFMATGVTWWARSRRTGQWRYLNTMKERLPELQLGKFDDDDIWDVALRMPHADITPLPPETYSKSGTGPWISRNVIHP